MSDYAVPTGTAAHPSGCARRQRLSARPGFLGRGEQVWPVRRAHQSLPALARRIMGEVGRYVPKPVTNVNNSVTTILPRSLDAVQRASGAPHIRGLRDLGAGPSL
jgi:hypothetical protein